MKNSNKPINKPIVVLDLEFLTKQKAPGREKQYYFPAITEVGAVKYSGKDKIDEFHSFCRLPHNKLSALDRKITKITNSDVDNAPDCADVLSELNDFCKNCEVYSWGPADFTVLKKNAQKHNVPVMFYINDGQKKFQEKLEQRIPISVNDALIHIGDYFEGQKHSALSDAYNEYKIIRYVFG